MIGGERKGKPWHRERCFIQLRLSFSPSLSMCLLPLKSQYHFIIQRYFNLFPTNRCYKSVYVHYNNNKNGKEIENTNTQSGCGHRQGQLWLRQWHYELLSLSLQSAFDYPNRAQMATKNLIAVIKRIILLLVGKEEVPMQSVTFHSVQFRMRLVEFLCFFVCALHVHFSKLRRGQMVTAQINLQLGIRFKISYLWAVVSGCVWGRRKNMSGGNDPWPSALHLLATGRQISALAFCVSLSQWLGAVWCFTDSSSLLQFDSIAFP